MRQMGRTTACTDYTVADGTGHAVRVRTLSVGHRGLRGVRREWGQTDPVDVYDNTLWWSDGDEFPIII